MNRTAIFTGGWRQPYFDSPERVMDSFANGLEMVCVVRISSVLLLLSFLVSSRLFIDTARLSNVEAPPPPLYQHQQPHIWKKTAPCRNHSDDVERLEHIDMPQARYQTLSNRIQETCIRISQVGLSFAVGLWRGTNEQWHKTDETSRKQTILEEQRRCERTQRKPF